MYAGAVALQRLQWSMFAAHLLYQLRLTFEADSVARHVLERVAWAVAVAELDEDDDIDAVQPQKTIGRLRSLVPEAGPLYGELSRSTHAGVATHLSVFEVNDEDQGIVRHGVTDWFRSATVMLALADFWVIAHEHTQRSHVREIVACEPANDYRPVEDRAFLTELRTALQRIRTAEQDRPSERRDTRKPR